MSRSLSLHGAVPEPAAPPRFALAAKGFRPFFLGAGLFAASVVPLWLLVLSGRVSPSPYLDPTSWHAHEMLFGFTTAVIAGFLLTAVGNWTGRETVVGAPLVGLALLWALGRVVMLAPGALPKGVPAVVDLSFLPLLAVAIGRPLIATRNRRNLVMLGVLGALFVANLVVHLDALDVLGPGSASRAHQVALDVVTLLLLLIAARIFPMFTKNGTGLDTIRSQPRLDLAVVLAMGALTALDAVAHLSRPLSLAAGLGAGLVGALALARSRNWGARASLSIPLLWVLHAGHLWLALGLGLRAVSSLGWLASSLATHALTIGAVGGLTLGMMARVSLGHTGRALAPPRLMGWAFAAVNVAALARVLGPLALPERYLATVTAAGVAWTAAFVAFVALYAPVLWSPRVDGKPG